MDKTSVDEFIDGWGAQSLEAREFFAQLKIGLEKFADTSLCLLARPGVSFSLRPQRSSQVSRDFFAIIDVIDDDPADRWLSICFYADTITDPEGKGDIIPGGLAGKDGCCFDVYSFEAEIFDYIMARLAEAWENVDGQ
ncbi:MAG: hypothetical protein CSB24_07100 [Deltaproteobacteria bacterium]|nr:MAG: hypothetical protein CSB24_07100 [Deltaproteobacteria bacterium]